MDTQERRILTVTCFGHFISHFNMLVFPAILLPLTRVLNLDLAAVLELSFYQYLLFGVSALFWGMAADRWGAKPFMMLFFGGAGLSSLAAAHWIESPSHFTLALAGIGLFSGIYHPIGLGLISKGVKRLSMGMAYNGMFGNLGLASAPLVAGLVNHLSGPAGAYVALALFNFIGFGLTFFLKIERSAPAGQTEAAPAAELSPFLILLAAMMLGGLAYRGATVILPTYFELKCAGLYGLLTERFPHGLSPNLMAASLASLIYLIGMAGQFSGGRAGERFDIRKAYLLFHFITLPPVFLMAFARDLPLVFMGLIYFFFLLGMQPLENTLVARLTPQRFHHSAFGAKFILTFGVGALAVKLVGAIESTRGIEAVFPALGVISTALVLTILLLLCKTSPIGLNPRPGRAGNAASSAVEH